MDQCTVRELFSYDPEGYLIWLPQCVSSFSNIRSANAWNTSWAYKKAGGLGKGNQYCRIRIRGRKYLTHRLIFLWHHGFMPEHVDHINGNKLDNRIENLREATKSQNCCNAKISKRNTTGFKGVSYDKNVGKFVSTITLNYKITILGYFNTAEEAHLAYCAASEKLHKEFGRVK